MAHTKHSTLKNVPWAVLFLQLLVKGGIAGVVEGHSKNPLELRKMITF